MLTYLKDEEEYKSILGTDNVPNDFKNLNIKASSYINKNTHGRIDLQLLPYYNRIVNLCFYIERNPDNQFICGLEKLLDDMNIRGHKTKDYDKTRWKLYNANLELLLASSAARCGSKVGLDVLVDYLDDIHSDFRKFAHKELKQISEKDYGYDMQKWMTYIENCDSLGLVPLQ